VNRLRTSLFWKLMVAFLLVVLVAVGSVAVIARQTTASEYQRLRQNTGQSSTTGYSGTLAAYYAQYGTWDGVSSVLGGGRGQGGRGGPPLQLAGPDGILIVDTMNNEPGGTLSAAELGAGEPILVDGQQVGTLLIGGRGAAPLSQAEKSFLDRVEMALITGAIVAIVVAFGLGFLLFTGITAPLRRLINATETVAEGDLTAQVPVPNHPGDEIDQLSRAFNQMTADLAHADRLRRDMTADIAHELRTPLTVIQGNLEAILDGIYPADAEHLAPILSKAQLLNHLVEDLRTLALADAGELALHPNSMDIGHLVKRTVRDFDASAKDKGVELHSEIPLGLRSIAADASRLEQVLGILLDNALRHTPSGGKVRVRLSQDDDKTQLSVSDTGEGIPSTELPHIFERFYRLQPDSGNDGRSGLGLAIAKAIVGAHGGHIWAESQIGHGTTVTLVIP
jgi:signal transduction histidine kinase